MAMYLGSKKVVVTNTLKKSSMKPFFDAGGKCSQSTATSFEGIIKYDDTVNVTDMDDMFYSCRSLATVPLFDTANVTNMNEMFCGCSKLTTIPLFNSAKVTNMNYMFYGCSELQTVPQFDTSNVVWMQYMFKDCSKLTTVPLFDTSKVSWMNYMFAYCSKLITVPAFNASKASLNFIFIGCSSLETIHMININSDLDISASTKFTREALLEIIGNLKARKSTHATLTMGSTNLAKLTDEDKAIATNKGWTLA